MKISVHYFIICQQAKPDRAKYPGLLQPLPVSNAAWKMVSMDFVTGLPKSRSADCIMVVVHKFSKFSHFISLSHPFNATVVAAALPNNIYRLHSMPLAIISDRDSI